MKPLGVARSLPSRGITGGQSGHPFTRTRRATDARRRWSPDGGDAESQKLVAGGDSRRKPIVKGLGFVPVASEAGPALQHLMADAPISTKATYVLRQYVRADGGIAYWRAQRLCDPQCTSRSMGRTSLSNAGSCRGHLEERTFRGRRFLHRARTTQDRVEPPKRGANKPQS